MSDSAACPSYLLKLARVVLFVFIMPSCQSPSEDATHKGLNSKVEFELIRQSQEINLPFEFNVALNLTIDAYTRNDTDFILLGDIEGRRLIEVDISNEKFSREIKIERIAKGRYPLFTHHYLSPDTIIVLKDISNEHGLVHDSVLFSVNRLGKETAIFNLNQSPFRKMGDSKDSSDATLFHHVRPMEFDGNRYYVVPLPLYSSLSQKEINKYGIPEVGFFDFNGTNDITFKAVPYQREVPMEGVKYADEQLDVNLNPKSKDFLFISHCNYPKLRLVNINTGDFIESNEAARLIPDPIPLKGDVGNSPSYNQHSTIFKDVLYDSRKSMVFRFAKLPVESELKPGDLSKFRMNYTWVGAYDESLDLIGQSIVPDWFETHPKPCYFKGQFVGLTQGEDLRKFRVQYTSLDTHRLKASEYDSLVNYINNIEPDVTARDISSLYKSYQLPKNSILITISNRSCPYCVDYSTKYFLAHLKRMEQDGIYLITSERSASAELRAAKSSHIIIDKENELDDLLKQRIDNPAIMLWNGQKVTRTMVLPPDEVKLIDSYLQVFQEQVAK
ncbi:hypothetical protein [Croceimicrobium hydrocarbonivorans]|uniref:Thioredoxin domain-containing protein n=1 Tax=Croceimicrobium hydrocarbonivorans TaxID=2761580 RepID=A0A7H0VAL7_9FLAO|nr:hypothetical protein [Croceimicrobium hydrocarbonivorans]QNR22765.1 hypothetical protein H4K34_10265 [Croceimicrobium hydrocarbonivorans]